jgi:hypothetical protein
MWVIGLVRQVDLNRLKCPIVRHEGEKEPFSGVMAL